VPCTASSLPTGKSATVMGDVDALMFLCGQELGFLYIGQGFVFRAVGILYGLYMKFDSTSAVKNNSEENYLESVCQRHTVHSHVN
jgi:hypothetical protein